MVYTVVYKHSMYVCLLIYFFGVCVYQGGGEHTSRDESQGETTGGGEGGGKTSRETGHSPVQSTPCKYCVSCSFIHPFHCPLVDREGVIKIVINVLSFLLLSPRRVVRVRRKQQLERQRGDKIFRRNSRR